MIVDSMTYEDILGELKKDALIINKEIVKHKKYYENKVKHTSINKDYYYPPIRFECNSGFHYVIQFINKGRYVQTNGRLRTYYYAWFNYRRGIFVLMPSTLDRKVYHFTIYHDHFFDRYRERFLNDTSISKIEAIDCYFKNNPKRPTTVYPTAKYPNGCWMIANDGLCLCNCINDSLLIEAKTFVTWEMAFPDQVEKCKEGAQMASEFGIDMDVLKMRLKQYEDD